MNVLKNQLDAACNQYNSAVDRSFIKSCSINLLKNRIILCVELTDAIDNICPNTKVRDELIYHELNNNGFLDCLQDIILCNITNISRRYFYFLYSLNINCYYEIFNFFFLVIIN